MGDTQRVGEHEELDATATGTGPDAPVDRLLAARQRRLTALKAAEGLWKNRTDVPKDGVKAQEQLRAEWH